MGGGVFPIKLISYRVDDKVGVGQRLACFFIVYVFTCLVFSFVRHYYCTGKSPMEALNLF